MTSLSRNHRQIHQDKRASTAAKPSKATRAVASHCGGGGGGEGKSGMGPIRNAGLLNLRFQLSWSRGDYLQHEAMTKLSTVTVLSEIYSAPPSNAGP
ncbi:hypothetical protein M422DRAFT_253521 [Sphaerobolus stellatus SS14]|uniref:Unplaced genomic scaffold SPHSTscaffold_49, whole genome shotgun sequence n=1 Tax=Sphaerobolus stellatus (strain SS14) TaxID=990650 RepID=A0A0C9VN19_SPHS4|nr:hypothetical protein M422DRAFT_253521 [Sphaerobolus stellatus SS14]